MEKETRIPCTSCEGTGGDFGMSVQFVEDWDTEKDVYLPQAILFLQEHRFFLFYWPSVPLGKHLLCMEVLISPNTLITTTKEPIPFTKNGQWWRKIPLQGIGMILYSSVRTECSSSNQTEQRNYPSVPMNSLFKGCSAGDLPYWSVIAEYFNGEKVYHLVGFSAIGEEPAYKMAVQTLFIILLLDK